MHSRGRLYRHTTQQTRLPQWFDLTPWPDSLAISIKNAWACLLVLRSVHVPADACSIAAVTFCEAWARLQALLG